MLRGIMQMEDTQDIDYVTFVIWGTGACGVGVNVLQINFFLVYIIVK